MQGPVDILAGDFYGRLSRQPVSKFKGLTAFPVEVKKKKNHSAAVSRACGLQHMWKPKGFVEKTGLLGKMVAITTGTWHSL